MFSCCSILCIFVVVLCQFVVVLCLFVSFYSCFVSVCSHFFLVAAGLFVVVDSPKTKMFAVVSYRLFGSGALSLSSVGPLRNPSDSGKVGTNCVVGFMCLLRLPSGTRM